MLHAGAASCSSTSPVTAASLSALASTTLTLQVLFARMPLLFGALNAMTTFAAVLYDWRAGVALCQANAHMSDVHTCRFNPYSPGNEFVSVGNKHTKFWNGDTLEGANGLFGKVGTTQQILCVAFLPSGQTLTGQLDGSIYVWEGGAIVSKIDKAHAHGVIGMIYCPLGIVTVGCDSQIKVNLLRSSLHAACSSTQMTHIALRQVWNPKSRECIGEIDLRPYAEDGLKLHGHSLDYTPVAEIGADVLRSLNIGSTVQGAPALSGFCYYPVGRDSVSGPDAGVLLVGTTCGSIIAVGIFSSSEVSVALRTSAAAIIVRGHMGDVNSVACDSDKQVELPSICITSYANISLQVTYTGSYDGLVRCWDMETKQCAYALSTLPTASARSHPTSYRHTQQERS
jgi:WD40 repeat protein